MIMIETERLRIRNFAKDDWLGLHEVITHYQASESAVYEDPWPTSSGEIMAITTAFSSGDEYLCVCLKATGRIIGLLAIERRKDQKDEVRNLGYIFDPACHRQGYATEGCRAVMRHVFVELGAAAILTGTNPANHASVCLLTKLGLKQINEGEFFLSREEWQASGTVASRDTE